MISNGVYLSIIIILYVIKVLGDFRIFVELLVGWNIVVVKCFDRRFFLVILGFLIFCELKIYKFILVML